MAKVTKQQRDNIQLRQRWFNQLRAMQPIIFSIYAPVLVLLVILKLQNRISVQTLTRDVSAVANAPFYSGAISNLGVLVWGAAVAITWFSFSLLREIGVNKEFSRFFLFSSGLTSILLLDDLFLVHEQVFPKYLNVPEKLVFVGYGIIILLYLVKFRKTILKTDFLLLILAFGFFGLSVVIDLLPIVESRLGIEDQFLLEDGFKLLGILSWLTYYAKACAAALKQIFMVQSSK